MEQKPVTTYRAVSSDGVEFEVTLLKATGQAGGAYARAPNASGQASNPSRPAATQRNTR